MASRLDGVKLHAITRRFRSHSYCGADAADDAGGTATAVHRVQPMGGRLVIFDSRTVLHEVRPHGRRDDRFALTIWLGGEHYPEFRCLRPFVS